MTQGSKVRAIAVALAACLLAPVTPAVSAGRPDRALYLEAQAALATLRQSPRRNVRRAEWDQVVARYRNVVLKYPQSGYCDDALLAVGDLYREMAGRFKSPRLDDEAVAAYRSLVSEYPSSGKGEQALYAVLEIARSRGDRKQVAEAARAYLAAFPESARAAMVRAAVKQAEKAVPQPAALSLPNPPPPGLARVFNLRSWSGDASTRIVIDVERKVAFRYERLSDPDRLFVDLDGARLHPNFDGRSFPVGDGLLEQVRVAQNKDSVVRVVLDFKNVKDQSVFYLENPIRLVVDVRGDSKLTPPVAAVTPAPALQPAAPPPITEVREATVLPPVEPTPPPVAGTRPTPVPTPVRVVAQPAPSEPAAKPRSGRPPAVVTTWPSGSPRVATATPPPRPVLPGGWTRVAPVPSPTPVTTPAPIWTPEPLDLPPTPEVEPLRLPAPRLATLVVPAATVSVPQPATRRTRPALPPFEGSGPGPAPSPSAPLPVRRAGTTAAPEPVPTPIPRPLPSVQPSAPARVDAPQAPQTNRAGSYSLARQLGLGARRIVIDAGHGGHDPGCIGRGGLQEKDLVLDVALRLERLVRDELGAEVVMTRGSDVFVPLEERTAIANSKAADLFLSVHANSSKSPAARGVETYFLNFTADPHAEAVAARENAISAATLKDLQSLVKAITLNSKIDESRDFAQSVQESMVARLRAEHPEILDRGVRTAPFYVLIGANMPSILAEISFVTSPTDERLLRTQEHRERIAASLFEGVRNYLAGLDRSGGSRQLTARSRRTVAAKGKR